MLQYFAETKFLAEIMAQHLYFFKRKDLILKRKSGRMLIRMKSVTERGIKRCTKSLQISIKKAITNMNALKVPRKNGYLGKKKLT